MEEKKKKPLHKRWWFWVLIIVAEILIFKIIVAIIVAPSSSSISKPKLSKNANNTSKIILDAKVASDEGTLYKYDGKFKIVCTLDSN
ncbi:hypothetical protein SOL51_11235, partial [Lactobacillus helveticus]|nr:hypothetical protein [Lactobacillus helveticus]